MFTIFLARVAWAAPAQELWVPQDRPLREFGALPGVAVGERRRLGSSGPEQQLFANDEGIRALTAARVPIAERAAGRRGLPLPAGIRSFTAGSETLAALAEVAQRGGFARWGASVEGRPIEALWLGQSPSTGAPVFRVIGAHHGDEPSSGEVALAVAEALVDGDGVDPTITAILDRATVWIVPYLNPDGFEAGTRENANDVDLNRNYDFEWLSTVLNPGTRPFSEPETAAVRAHATFQRATLSLSLHSGAVNIGWPWNYTVDNPAEASSMGALARVYAEACGAPDFWLTQGADWYLSNGDLNDWAYGRHGTFDFTVEVASVDTVEAVNWHLAAVLAVLAVPPAVEGTVTDAVSGVPVEARLWVDGGQPFTSDAATGRFASMELGESLRVDAPGYLPVEIPLLEGPLEVALTPDTLGAGRLPVPVLFERTKLGSFTLVRPGAASVYVDGPVDPLDLDPGWYSVEWPDGSVWPRALLVEHATGASLAAWSTRGDELEIEGDGFADGARAWVLAGADRVPVEVPVVVHDPRGLALDLSEVDVSPPADAVLWVGGSVLAISDLALDGRRERSAATCGCVTARGTWGGWAWSVVGVGGLAWWRRRIRS